jgi:hypothetical protein
MAYLQVQALYLLGVRKTTKYLSQESEIWTRYLSNTDTECVITASVCLIRDSVY